MVTGLIWVVEAEDDGEDFEDNFIFILIKISQEQRLSIASWDDIEFLSRLPRGLASFILMSNKNVSFSLSCHMQVVHNSGAPPSQPYQDQYLFKRIYSR